MSLLDLFCNVDDFIQRLRTSEAGRILGLQDTHPGPKPQMSLSEIITIIIFFR